MPQKKQRKSKRKFIVTLTEREALLLSRYASSHKLTRPVALKRMVSSALREHCKRTVDIVPENQLNLFDTSYQISLFDIIDNEQD